METYDGVRRVSGSRRDLQSESATRGSDSFFSVECVDRCVVFTEGTARSLRNLETRRICSYDRVRRVSGSPRVFAVLVCNERVGVLFFSGMCGSVWGLLCEEYKVLT